MTNQYSYEDSFANVKVEAPKKKIAESNISSAAKVYMLSRTQEDGTVIGESTKTRSIVFHNVEI